ncbi:hypothetical protein QQ045_008086 [Rhodiola kirilowii]
MVGFIYCFNRERDRCSLWRSIFEAMDKEKGAWVFIGDFNCIKNQTEKLNGSRVRNFDVKELKFLFDNSDLHDILASGNFFTWSDRHETARRIWCKLDRILVNSDLVADFPTAHDKKRWFRFQSFRALTDEYKACLAQNWKGGCRNLFLLQKALRHLKGDLKVAMKTFGGDMNLRVERSRNELFNIQNALSLQPNDLLLQDKEKKSILEMRKLLRYQYIFNCQRVRLGWASEGDLNSSYFHSIVNGRRNTNSIRCIQSENGNYSFEPSAVNKAFVDYFKLLFNERLPTS